MIGSKVRVAVIGAGYHAMLAHYPALAEMDDVDVCAVAELDEARRRAAMEQFGVNAGYSDYREMLDRERPDAVFVVLQPDRMLYIVTDILRRGVPMFLEKPPGLTAFQAEAMAETAAASGTLNFVGFNRRYESLLLEGKRRVEEHGAIDHFVVTFCKHGTDKPVYCEGTGSVLLYDAIHAVDMLRWLGGGEPEALATVTRESVKDQNVKYVALARFAGGRTGLLSCCWDSGKRTLAAEMHGGGSVAFVEVSREMRFYHAGGEGVVIKASELAGDHSNHRAGGYFAEDRAFVDCVKSGCRPANDLADAAKTMRLAERLYCAGI